MTTNKINPIRPMLGFRTMSDASVLARATAVLAGLTGNAKFLNPAVDLATFKTMIDTFAAAIAAALDGSKKAIAAKDGDRETLIKMMRQLAVYVEANCGDDLAIFTTSGFQPATTTKSSAAPLTPPVVKKIVHGANSGQLLVRVAAIRNAASYDLRYAAMANGNPGPWTTETMTTVKKGMLIGNLTPGTVYAFQVRALGPLGSTDWSDSVTMMST